MGDRRVIDGIRAQVAGEGPAMVGHRPVMTAVRDSVTQVDIGSVHWAVTSVVPRRPDQRQLLAGISRPVLVVTSRMERASFRLLGIRQFMRLRAAPVAP
jgi:3-oxoadipate enol-lactonase